MLTEEKRQRLRQLVRKAWLRALGRAFGLETLRPEERAELGKLADRADARDAAYARGVISVDKTQGTDLSPTEELARRAALEQAGELIDGLTDRASARYEQAFTVEDLRVQTAGAIERRESPRTLSTALRQASGDLSRDWDRVAVTELQAAYQEGRARAIKGRSGDQDPEVFKRPAPDACEHCLRLHLGPDGHPRIFRLSTLETNGDNTGRRKRDWRAVLGPVHPHCQCDLTYVAPGWGFDEDGDLVPEGTFGIRYQDEQAIAKSLSLEDRIQAAARQGGEVEIQGLRIRVEANAGDVRRWRLPGGGQRVRMLRFAYGEFPDTMGHDGDPVDVYLGPDPSAPFAWVVDQRFPDGRFDEQKVFLGWPTANSVQEAYALQYDGLERWGGVMQIPIEELRTKLATLSQHPDGVLKAADDARDRKLVEGHDRGWSGNNLAADMKAHTPGPKAQRPAEKPLQLQMAEEMTREAERRRQVIPVVPLFEHESTPRDPMPLEPKERTEEEDEERTKEAERNLANLEARAEEKRFSAEPSIPPSIQNVLPTVKVRVG